MYKIESEKWVNRYTLYLSNYAKNRVPFNLVQDLVQETFYHGLKSLNSFKGKAHERTWLTSILKFKIVDYYRKSSSKKGRVNEKLLLESDYNETHSVQLNNMIKTENNIEANYYAKELRRIIEQAIETLSEKERQVLVLGLKGYKTYEICEALQITKNCCWVYNSKAKKKMKSFITVNWLNAA